MKKFSVQIINFSRVVTEINLGRTRVFCKNNLLSLRIVCQLLPEGKLKFA